MDAANAKLANIKNQLVTPTSKQVELEEKVNTAKTALDLANTDVASKQAAKNDAQALKNKNLAALDIAKSNVETKEKGLKTATSNKNTADQSVESKKLKLRN